jgi:hypothetical protein
MAWVETSSPSFTARHEAEQTTDAETVLDRLESQRAHLGELYPRLPEDVTVILHDSWLQLALALPRLPVARRLATPAARRYMVGGFAQREVHVLAPARLRELAGGPDSLEALMRAPECVYTMLVAGTDNPLLPPPFRPRTVSTLRRAPWLLEGIGQHLSGQVPLLRPAISIRLRGGPVRFPPSRRDSPLVAGALFDLLACERGEAACVRLARQPVTDATAALETAFDRPTLELISLWRSHLGRLAAPAPAETPLSAALESPDAKS